MKRILAVVLSLCLLLCFPVSVSAEDEDLLSHYTGDDKAYLRFLFDYFCEKDMDSTYSAVYNTGLEMARMINTCHNDLQSHPYLRGTVDPETGEITITGMQVTRFKAEICRDYFDRYTFISSFIKNYSTGKDCFNCKGFSGELVIPDEIDAHPVTRIAASAFWMGNYNDYDYYQYRWQCSYFGPTSLVIGDNVREIDTGAFAALPLQEITFGKNVQVIGRNAFAGCMDIRKITSWGDSLTTIGALAFERCDFAFGKPDGYEPIEFPPSLPDTVEYIGERAFSFVDFSGRLVLSQSVKKILSNFLWGANADQLVVLSKDMEIDETDMAPNYDLMLPGDEDMDTINFVMVQSMYCYSGSTFEQYARKFNYRYTLIDGDSLLWDGEAVEGNVLHLNGSMTEAELRSHLSIDGTSSEIQIDGLQDGKVVNGTTVTLFHTIAQAPGKVYTVEKTPVPVSAQIETLPTKTNYIYKEAFDPTGLSLRITYDNGDETVVTDNITCTGTDLTLGTNTITATYENVSVTFTVTVSAEDEDLLSHYTGDDKAYSDFLFAYFRALHEEERQQHPYSFDYYYDYLPAEEASREMANMYNVTHSDFEHPYLCGTISEETGEITITGLRAAGYGRMESAAMTPIGWFFPCVTNLVIPDEIDGHPVTKIEDRAFDGSMSVDGARYLHEYVQSVTIGNNVREIGKEAFRGFYERILYLGNSIQVIHDGGLFIHSLSKTVVLGRSFGSQPIQIGKGVLYPIGDDSDLLYGYTGSPAESFTAEHGFRFVPIDLDVLLYDGKPIKGNELKIGNGMTEEEFRSHLSIDGTSSEIQIDGLQDGKVVNGTTVTLYHTIAQAPGKVYTVEKTPAPVSAQIETLPTKTNYIYKEQFEPSGLSLRITYDNGDETVVTDGITCTGTDLTLGTNTITATYENVSATFTVTVRAPQPVSAVVETLPTKTNYIYKEQFDPTGLSLRITYDNGDETVVTDNITYTGTELTLGTNTITATYENVSATFTVTVRAPQPVSAQIETLPAKTSYIYKEAFDPTGLSLRITYDNGDETVVTDDITCTGTDLTVGTNTITATYETVSATFAVTVRYTWWQMLIRILLFGFLWY